MSYEGYYQVICERGHYFTVDCYTSPEDLICWSIKDNKVCTSKVAWKHAVDKTNGDGYLDYVKPTQLTFGTSENSATFEIPKSIKIIGYLQILCTEGHYGLETVRDTYKYKPVEKVLHDWECRSYVDGVPCAKGKDWYGFYKEDDSALIDRDFFKVKKHSENLEETTYHIPADFKEEES